jgi:putative membrane protein
MESLLITDRRVGSLCRVKPDSVAAIRPWAFNQGFYNLFLALGCLGGIVVSYVGGGEVVGRTLTYFTCACMVAAALVLVATDRRMVRGALFQGTAPALALLFAALL